MRTYQMVNIDPARLKNALCDIGVSMSQASYQIGKSSAYIGNCIRSQKISKTSFDLLCKTFDLDPAPLIAREKIIPKSEEQTDFGYSIRMNITPSVLTMTLFFGEEVVYIARAKIKGNR